MADDGKFNELFALASAVMTEKLEWGAQHGGGALTIAEGALARALREGGWEPPTDDTALHLERVVERLKVKLEGGTLQRPSNAECEEWQADLRTVMEELKHLEPEKVSPEKRARFERRMQRVAEVVELCEGLVRGWLEKPEPDWALTEFVCRCGAKFHRRRQDQKRCTACETADSAHRKYNSAFRDFATALKQQLSDEEVLAVAKVTTTETGMFMFDDGGGVGFVFHGVFGKRITAGEVERFVEEHRDSGKPIKEHVGALLNGYGEVEVEDWLSGVRRS